MTSKFNRQPQRIPLTDQKTGLITPEWYRLINDLIFRIGGVEALTNLELADEVDAALLGVFDASPQPSITRSEVMALIESMREQRNGPGIDWQTAYASQLLSAPQRQQVQSGGFTNPMTTAGDLIVGGSGGAPGRQGVGSNGQVLTVVSGVPAWAAQRAFTFSASAPASPGVGDEWIDANTGIRYEWIDDGTSTQWVEF